MSVHQFDTDMQKFRVWLMDLKPYFWTERSDIYIAPTSILGDEPREFKLHICNIFHRS